MKKALTFLLILLLNTVYGQVLDNEQLLDMMQTQRYREATMYIKSVFPGAIDNDKTVARLAYCYMMSGNLIEAEKNYKTLLAKDSVNKSALFNLAAINVRRGNLLESKAYYQKILKLDSTNLAVHKQLAEVCGRLRDTVGLMASLKTANAIDPIDADVAYDYSAVLIKKKNYPLADKVLAPAYQADTLNVLLIQNKMYLANRVKDYKTSIEFATKAVSLGDNSGQTLNLLALGYFFMQRYSDCIKTYGILEASNMSNESTFYYTALAYRRLNMISKSNEYLVKSLKDAISSNVPVYYQELSINAETLKKYNTSIAHLKKASEFEGRNVFNYSQARIYDQNLKNNKTALKYYRLFIKKYDVSVDDSVAFNYSQRRVKELELPKSSLH